MISYIPPVQQEVKPGESIMNIVQSDGMYNFRGVHFTNEEIDILSKLVDEAIFDNKFDSKILIRLHEGFSSLKDNKTYHAYVESF